MRSVDGTLRRVRRLYEKGKYAESAEVLQQERRICERQGDGEPLELVDDWISQLRGHLDGEDREAFERGLREGSRVVDLSPLGLLLAALGAGTMLISVFLPYADANSFATIEQNTLIQNGFGWAFVVLSLGEAATLYRAYRVQSRPWGPIIAGLLGIAAAIYFGKNGGNSLQLCSVATGTNCEIANPGIGIYVAGVGGLMMLVGGLQLRNSRKITSANTPAAASVPGLVADTRPTKECPECAETVLAAARLCKHCGHRFSELPDAAGVEV